ncbi:hypothetical protein PoB_006860800 [Plakobranchus ocellatus]|uniref:Uncharacterized protein n=1 Tax=Plakobranchus ocellatus TaxID=259542 RepID=A0AAV4DCZ2_9GAST|nr:hypothetical protein PoB_006860800 [Plakobranchus ocellatus]
MRDADSTANSYIKEDSFELQQTNTNAVSNFEPRQLDEITELHRKMLDMQNKNYELTKSVARAGAETAQAVKQLLNSLQLGPGASPLPTTVTSAANDQIYGEGGGSPEAPGRMAKAQREGKVSQSSDQIAVSVQNMNIRSRQATAAFY